MRWWPPGCWDLCCVSAWSFLQTWPVQPLLVLILLLLSFFFDIWTLFAVLSLTIICFVLFYFRYIQIYFCMPLIVLYSARGQRSLAFLVRQRRLTLSFMPYCYVDMSNVASTCARAWALSSPDALFFHWNETVYFGHFRAWFCGYLDLIFWVFLCVFFFCSLVWLKQVDLW